MTNKAAYVIHGDYYVPHTDIDGADPVVQTHYAVETADTEAEAQALVADLTITAPTVCWYFVRQGGPVAEPVTDDVDLDAAEPADVLYIAGWNVPGCLPEVAPAIFDNETDAVRYLTDTVNRFWEEDYRIDTTWTAWNQVDDKWSAVFASLPYETAPFNIVNNVNNGLEHTFRDEARAHAARRQYINQGARVSLIAFDGSRDVYVFDLYDDRNFTASSEAIATAPFNIANNDRSLTFWVTVVPKATIPTYDSEGN